MWLLNLFLPLNYGEPLLTARLLSVTAGFITLILLRFIIKALGGSRQAQLYGALVYLILPFTFFHDRMALIDSLLVTFLSASFLTLIKVRQTGHWKWASLAGIFWGLALMSKTSALWFPLIMPLMIICLPEALDKQSLKRVIGGYMLTGVIGLCLFYSLKMSPLFPFLFNRSADFSLTLSEILQGEWRRSGINGLNLGRYLFWYVTWPVLVLPLVAGFLKPLKKQSLRQRCLPLTLVCLAISLTLPLILLGKIVFSRYYLPTIIFLIPAATLAWERLQAQRYRILGWLLTGWLIIQSIWFIYPWYSNLNQAHLPREDREQYLTEWSAGFGNREVAEWLKQAALTQPIAVATEGYFGTLPDGLSIYFDHNPSNEQVKIFGVGQPVRELADSIKEQVPLKDTFLVVNEHRLSLNLDSCCTLVKRFPRPFGGPALLLIKVNQI